MTAGVRRLTLACAVVVLVSPTFVAGAADRVAAQGAGRRGGDALDLLAEAVEAGERTGYRGRLALVVFDDRGPSLAELDVAHDPSGDLRVSGREAWMVGRTGDDAFYARAGNPLRLGNVADVDFDPRRLTEKYEVRRGERAELDTGTATVVDLHERATGMRRGRLYIDAATGLVVRRETYLRDGRPARLVAFTELDVHTEPLPAPTGVAEHDRGASTRLSAERMRALDDLGWSVPEELPGGFTLHDGYTVPEPGGPVSGGSRSDALGSPEPASGRPEPGGAESEGGAVHLVYSDGLYTLSVYQQPGRLDAAALDGAESQSLADRHVYRWPGRQPERVVWAGDGLTFTAVSDAPRDALDRALSPLPHADSPSLPERLARGLGRVVDFLWPFN